ncbi:phage portal protein, HK97 family [Bacteroidales bacterium Barb4]|nr:phage portal protein, HK97 family [Bacteroidales bacterium Barb4]
MKCFEVEMENKLLFDSEIGEYEIKFNLDGLLRGDLKTRSEYYAKAIQFGWSSRNEVRIIEGLNTVEGLDEFIYPSNEFIVGEKQNENPNNTKKQQE